MTKELWISPHLFVLLYFFSHSLSFLSITTAVKMDASSAEGRTMQCSYRLAMPQAHYNPPLHNHSHPHSPHSHRSPEPKPALSPSQHDRQAQLTVPVSMERKPSIEVKMTGPQMTGVVKIVRRRKARGQRTRAAL